MPAPGGDGAAAAEDRRDRQLVVEVVTVAHDQGGSGLQAPSLLVHEPHVVGEGASVGGRSAHLLPAEQHAVDVGLVEQGHDHLATSGPGHRRQLRRRWHAGGRGRAGALSECCDTCYGGWSGWSCSSWWSWSASRRAASCS
jgi:hypothetical protein